MTTQLLIDADFVLYRACAAAERVASFPNEAGHIIDIINCSRDEAKDNFLGDVEGYVKKLFADEAILIFSGPNNFRKTLWPLYKANRASTRKPVSYWQVIEDIKAQGDYRVVSEDCLEGDDYIGILATRPSPIRRVIVSEDKDMMTLPNTEIYRQGDLVEIDEEEADRFWMHQTLMGDATDGYKGCPGIGTVGADKVLAQGGERWENILQAYRKGCRDKPNALADAQIETPEDLALINARLARILRHADWDSEKREPILWTPKETSKTE